MRVRLLGQLLLQCLAWSAGLQRHCSSHDALHRTNTQTSTKDGELVVRPALTLGSNTNIGDLRDFNSYRRSVVSISQYLRASHRADPAFKDLCHNSAK